ncbi:hypothetical protein KP509_33G003700 [Ceratopteris richardii]|uniref:F-box domain-containing protein n=1 Tax=Ceratopteris richardii TaxID=49495 RepID=A0A8T2QMX6_CERRI|nr:hypothetical protein KP509_33G003700 [Ceratopteris richardii]
MYQSLRKALGSVISRPYSLTSADFGNEDDDNTAANASGMVGGAEQASPFERISADILYSIFSLLPGHDLAAASIVCKAWSSIIQGPGLEISLAECSCHQGRFYVVSCPICRN